MTEKQERIAAAILIVAAFLLFNLYSVATPLFEASDELWHYPMVQHLVAGGGLPIQRKDQTDAEAPWRQEGSQPPLYYAVAALVSAPFDHSGWRELRRINPHADMGVPTRDGNANAMLHTMMERNNAGATLAVRAARFTSILMSTATVFFAYLISRYIFRATEFRLATLVFVAFVPMFAFISGAINNDNAAVLFSTMGLWWALRMVQRQDVSAKAALLAGAITAAGALSKSSAVGLLGLFGLAAVLAITKPPPRVAATPPSPANQNLQGRGFGSVLLPIFSFVALLVCSFLVLAGWWFVRNLNLYGDLLGWNAFLDVVGRRDQPATLAQLWSEREGFMWAYWGVFGTLNVIMPPWVYTALNGLVVLAVVGAGRGFIRQIKKAKSKKQLELPAPFLLLAFWFVLIFVSLLRWSSLTPASQGRLMFPCIVAIAAFVAHGLGRLHRGVLLGACVFLIGLAAYVPFGVIAPAYALPQNTWVQRLREPIQQTFGGALLLAEGQADATDALTGNEATLRLNWQLNAPLPKNYSVFVHLVDEDSVIVAQRDMFPGQGNMALSELPTGYRWSDHYTLRISPLQLAPKRLRWRVGVYDKATGERLQTNDGKTFAEFGDVTLKSDGAPRLLRYTNGAQLMRYTMPRVRLQAGQPLTVTLNWDNTALQGDYAVSVQVLDDAANKIGSDDFALPKGISKDKRTIAISPNAAPGVYRLLLVVYAPADFKRVPAYSPREEFVGDQIELTRLRLGVP